MVVGFFRTSVIPLFQPFRCKPAGRRLAILPLISVSLYVPIFNDRKGLQSMIRIADTSIRMKEIRGEEKVAMSAASSAAVSRYRK
jgi:hypothetical protein